MFDDNTKSAWQGISPPPELKERALKQQPRKVIPFPRNLLKTAAAAAACLIVAVHVLGVGQPLVEVNGQPIKGTVMLQSAAIFTRDVMPLSTDEGITVELTVDADTHLAVSGGTLEGSLWTVDEPGAYLLQATKGSKTQCFLLSCDAETGLWTLRPEN